MQAPPLHQLQAGDKLTMTFHKNPKGPGFMQHHQPGGAGVQTPAAGAPMARRPMPMDPKAMLLAALARR